LQKAANKAINFTKYKSELQPYKETYMTFLSFSNDFNSSYGMFGELIMLKKCLADLVYNNLFTAAKLKGVSLQPHQQNYKHM